MKKKIGIVTHYYGSINYGGNLQAYALCLFLSKLGYDAEQICFSTFEKNTKEYFAIKSTKEIFQALIRKAKHIFLLPFKKLNATKKSTKPQHFYEARKKSFNNFNQNVIPHSQKVYTRKNISDTIDIYDGFITGSDQVWNLLWYNSICFLAFVPSKKLKISYAASLAMNSITPKQSRVIKKHLKDYTAISVREKSAIKLLEDISPIKPKKVLDPTLLLTRDDWDKVCADVVIDDEYIFCYFLGENTRGREIAKTFGKSRHLKLVVIPQQNNYDEEFGNIKLYDASPEQFISLIKHAKYVFTDSFHAVIFSNIYQKQYFVFNRNEKGEMSSRITDISELFGQEERFCARPENESIEYVTSLSDIDYTKENKVFEKIKRESIDFLEGNLRD